MGHWQVGWIWHFCWPFRITGQGSTSRAGSKNASKPVEYHEYRSIRWGTNLKFDQVLYLNLKIQIKFKK